MLDIVLVNVNVQIGMLGTKTSAELLIGIGVRLGPTGE